LIADDIRQDPLLIFQLLESRFAIATRFVAKFLLGFDLQPVPQSSLVLFPFQHTSH